MNFLLASLHLPTILAVSALATLFVAAMTTLAARHQPAYQGLRWWLGAQWLAGLGVATLLGVERWPALWPLAVLLLMQWPVAVSIGIRRFHPRVELPGSIATDLLMLSGAMGLWLIAYVAPLPFGADATATILLPMGGGVLHLHAASVIRKLSRESSTPALATVRALLLASAAVHWLPILLSLVPGAGANAARAAIVLPLALDAMTVLNLGVVLIHERAAHSLHETHARLRMLANVDGLTGMPNRRHFQELADQMVAQRHQTPTLMIFDLDHFKRVNDEHGHAVGDAALRLVSRAARASFRTADVVARFGGDEFVALLPTTSRDEAMAVADRVVQHLKRARRGRPSMPPLGLSFGVVTMHEGEALDTALARADEALYEAKRQGRCRAVAADTRAGRSVFAESRPLGLDELGGIEGLAM